MHRCERPVLINSRSAVPRSTTVRVQPRHHRQRSDATPTWPPRPPTKGPRSRASLRWRQSVRVTWWRKPSSPRRHRCRTLAPSRRRYRLVCLPPRSAHWWRTATARARSTTTKWWILRLEKWYNRDSRFVLCSSRKGVSVFWYFWAVSLCLCVLQSLHVVLWLCLSVHLI